MSGFSKKACTCSGSAALPTEIVQDCDGNDVEVSSLVGIAGVVETRLCPDQLGIETALAEVGCTTDTDGNLTGRVFLCKKSEDLVTGDVEWHYIWVPFGTASPPIEGYTGVIEDCKADCTTGSVGTLTAWSQI